MKKKPGRSDAVAGTFTDKTPGVRQATEVTR
jgi:hypothetical protein